MQQIPLEPTLEEWRQLYQTADEFRQLAPWDYMADTDLFAVVEPESGRTGYCSVFGAGGEIFGLAVFLGARGFATFNLQASSHERDFAQVDATELMERLPYALMATFENVGDLEPHDIEQIQELGLQYRGAKTRPMFRLHEPGYGPWYLGREDVRFLAFVLAEAKSVVRRFKQNPDLVQAADPLRTIFTRVPLEGSMVDSWTEAPPLEPAQYPALDTGDLLRRTRYQKPRQTTTTWEVDYFYLPRLLAQDESGRPAFPRVVLCVDRSTGRPVDTLAATAVNFYLEAPMRIFETMLRRGVPRRIRVRRLNALATLAPVAEAVGAKLVLVERLDLLDAYKHDLVDHIGDDLSLLE